MAGQPQDGAAATARALAQQLVSRERRATEGPADVVRVMERVVERLRVHLSRWFGPDGFDALLARALHRARANHDVLREVRNGSQGMLEFGRLAKDLQARPSDEANEVVLALLEAFVILLARMLGDDLAKRLIEQSWTSEPRADHAAYSESSSSESSAEEKSTS